MNEPPGRHELESAYSDLAIAFLRSACCSSSLRLRKARMRSISWSANCGGAATDTAVRGWRSASALRNRPEARRICSNRLANRRGRKICRDAAVQAPGLTRRAFPDQPPRTSPQFGDQGAAPPASCGLWLSRLRGRPTLTPPRSLAVPSWGRTAKARRGGHVRLLLL